MRTDLSIFQLDIRRVEKTTDILSGCENKPKQKKANVVCLSRWLWTAHTLVSMSVLVAHRQPGGRRTDPIKAAEKHSPSEAGNSSGCRDRSGGTRREALARAAPVKHRRVLCLCAGRRVGGIVGSDGEVRHIQIGPARSPDVPNELPPAQTASGRGREAGVSRCRRPRRGEGPARDHPAFKVAPGASAAFRAVEEEELHTWSRSGATHGGFHQPPQTKDNRRGNRGGEVS